MKAFYSILVFLCLSATVLAFETTQLLTIQTRKHTTTVRIAIADTEPERALGLMGVRDLQENQGMLFVYPNESHNRFWMKNTPTSLDMLFISRDKKIVFIAKSTVPFSEDVIDPEVSSQFVLEVKAGFVEREHISVGDSVQF